MKKLIACVVLLTSCILGFAQGVDFQQLTFNEALAKAKAEKKLVFMDCYTSWCGPCKYMTTKIFPKPEAGEFFNPRFVSVKFDMEKGEGKELKQKLGVKAFPTFFIIQADGTVQHCIVGGGELDQFIERVKKGLNKKTSLLYLKQQYEEGKLNKKQLMLYQDALTDAYDQKNADQIARELMGQLSDKEKLKKEFWPLFETESCKVGSDDFNLILANLPKVEKNIGKEKLDRYLYRAYDQALKSHIYPRGKQAAVSLEELERQIARLNIERKEELVLTHRLADMVVRKDVQGLISGIVDHASTIQGSNLITNISVLLRFSESLTKADYIRLVKVEDELLANNEKNKDFLTNCFDFFKRKAHKGVYFEDLTLEQALAKAKQQHKLVFVDGYTSWCGPCKYMVAEVFPQEKLGDFMNEKFISVKYDMEKGKGPEIAKKFSIYSYPTFLILNPDGSLRHRLLGGCPAELFLNKIKEAFDETKATGLLEAKYKAGSRDKELMSQYVKSLESWAAPNVIEIAEELFQSLTEEEKVSETYWFLFKDPDYLPNGTKAAQYLLENRDKYNQNIGKEEVNVRLAAPYLEQLRPVFFGRKSITLKELEQMRKEIVRLGLADIKALQQKINIAKAVLEDNLNQLLVVCERESLRMPAEEFPYNLIYPVKSKLTQQQAKRWSKVYRQLAGKCKNVRYKNYLLRTAEDLEKI